MPTPHDGRGAEEEGAPAARAKPQFANTFAGVHPDGTHSTLPSSLRKSHDHYPYRASRADDPNKNSQKQGSNTGFGYRGSDALAGLSGGHKQGSVGQQQQQHQQQQLSDGSPCSSGYRASRALRRSKSSIGSPHSARRVGIACPEAMLRCWWSMEDYTIVKCLYKGSTSKVYKAICQASQEVVVLKAYIKRKMHEIHHVQVMREIDIHSKLLHPNIISFYGSFEDDAFYYIIEEYAQSGDLFDIIRAQKALLPERRVVNLVARPLLEALDYMHREGYSHRDIKPENIVFNGHMELKLADFGLSINTNAERAVSRVGTLEYMAPEVISNPLKRHSVDFKQDSSCWYDEKVDVWGVAVVIYELMFGTPAFGWRSSNTSILETHIKRTDLTFPTKLREISPDAQDFLEVGLDKAPHMRESAERLLGHSWIRKLGALTPACPASRSTLGRSSTFKRMPSGTMRASSPDAGMASQGDGGRHVRFTDSAMDDHHQQQQPHRQSLDDSPRVFNLRTSVSKPVKKSVRPSRTLPSLINPPRLSMDSSEETGPLSLLGHHGRPVAKQSSRFSLDSNSNANTSMGLTVYSFASSHTMTPEQRQMAGSSGAFSITPP